MILEGKIAVYSFSVSSIWALAILNYVKLYQHDKLTVGYCCLVAVLHLSLIFLIKHFKIIWRSYILGVLFLFGIWILKHAASTVTAFGVYVCVVAFFHISEYIATAALNPSTLRLDSFLINHSFAYNLAHLLGCTEYFLWVWLYPEMKLWRTIQICGFCLCIFGELLRKAAMYTAGTNFTHLIQYEKRIDHVLITSGVYSLCRHPSYVGWFCWSIGTQVLICNPVCFVGYVLVSWKFFDERIYEEEILLLNFFKTDYLKYQAKVPTGIPFIKGYQMHAHSH